MFRFIAGTGLAFYLYVCSPVFGQSPAVAVEGTVTDQSTQEPIPYVTVQVDGTGSSTLTNEDGRYRILVAPGSWTIRFTHVAFSSHTLEVTAGDDLVEANVSMTPAPYLLPGMKVYERAYDPAQRIIVEAISRKQDILSRIHDYRYDAYTKFTVFDLAREGVESVFLMTETQTTAYWEQPDKYKEVITARRQSSNMQAEENLVTVGEILNFNKNRIDLGKYAVVSPTAKDALDYYNYYLLDTIYIDDLAIFRLEIEPKQNADPLFVGTIDIVDETFDVVSVDVGTNDVVRFAFVDSLRYSQRFAEFDGEYWMPIEIRFEADVHLEIKFPGIPKDMHFSHVASLYRFEFEKGHPPGTFGEFALVVDEEADDIDSATWSSHQTIPLTQLEQKAYVRIDSLEKVPPSFGDIALTALGVTAFLAAGGEESLFRYNRVEGPFLGLGANLPVRPDLNLAGGLGYSFELEDWEWSAGASYRLWADRRLWFGGTYHDQVVRRPTLVTDTSSGATFFALLLGWDPHDYFKEEGFSLWAEGKLLNRTTLRVTYQDYRQRSLPVATDFSLFDGDVSDSGKSINPDTLATRYNPPIADGDLRSIGAELKYDSRKLMLNKGRVLQGWASEYITARVGVEYAGDDFLDNDFHFWRYYARVERVQRTLGLGRTRLVLYAGGSDHALPPQRYYMIDHGYQDLTFGGSMLTLNQTNFYGDHVAMIRVNHDFDQLLFKKSHLPLINDVPFTLSIHGSLFWSEFRSMSQDPELQPSTGARPYSELGFGIGNLTPFMSPFSIGVWFTWQLSKFDYGTNSISFGWGFAL